MGTMRINSDSISKYFGFLKKLDNESKKRLIEELSKSKMTESTSLKDLKRLYGAWDDNRSAEEIIEDIRNSRTENRPIEDFD